jgi:hypothetical protein
MFTKSLIVCSAAIVLAVSAMSPASAMSAGSKAKKAFAQAPVTTSSNDVYLNGQYVGSDPDPRVRWTILREEKGRFGN